ncbi:D-glycero-beta-D-manno-heptose 1,7-bisphosphate 7-phosphatase [Piscinibacter sakaiensis]|uniref:D,D-heptose 1,7-bisphosphate phosphatase n=1 Tax=Piscinibacter sakaiensis TaxID=1547922 RepID=A0A0K8NXM0_PISS1|nr:D-glycero-beta-D-manno-heptose 1,7-bisphosphate 7-phosphatase [Piscinibacter sakaiensis]GAP35131.1 D-glycero-D-manno-heptose 1,7-bisphosphate phosphatase [Piscinibacter sakaiensis]
MKLVILDRDGTLNEDRDDYVKSPDEWQPIPGALEAVARLTQAGWHAVVATNQSGLGRGLFDMATLNAMHQKLAQCLAEAGGRIDAVFFCPHVPADECDCRKPLPGLMLQVAERYGVDPRGIPVVGDALRDLQAAHAAGCEPHLVRSGKSAGLDEEGLARMHAAVPGLTVHADLGAFADLLLRRERQARGLAEDRGGERA